MDNNVSIATIIVCICVVMIACANGEDGDSSNNASNHPSRYGDPENLTDDALLQVVGPPVASENLAYVYVDAICRTARDCCRDRGMSIPEGMCDTLERNYRDRIAISAENPLIVYDKVAAGNCVERIRKSVEACRAPNHEFLCEGIFRGTLTLNELCDTSMECADFEGATTTCDEDNDGVKRCVIGGATGPDGVQSAAGESCTATCDMRLDGSSSCWSVVTLTQGAITRDTMSIPRYCLRQEKLRCDDTQLVCVALQPPHDSCQDSYDCDVGLRCLDDLCQPLAGSGEVCRTSNDCADQGRCVDAICIAMISLGEVCGDDDRCKDGGICTDGICTLPDEFDDICEGDIG